MLGSLNTHKVKLILFIKLSIAIKEANETEYWIDLLFETKYLSQTEFDIIKPKIIELLKLLTSIINTSKK